jgi:hypothetical protein
VPPILPAAPLDLPAPQEPTRSLLRSARRLPGGVVDGEPVPVEIGPTCPDGRVTVVELCDTDVALDELLDLDRDPTRIWQPLAAVAGDECGSRQWRAPGATDRARDYLRAYRHAAIARQFWTGEIIEPFDADPRYGNLWLAHPDVAQPDTDAVGTITGLALIEQAIAACGGPGFIHATVQLATMWAADGLVTFVNGSLQTVAMGSTVVVDAGYPGTGPGVETGSAPPGTSWAYGTSTVWAAEGDIVLVPDPGSANSWAESLDRTVNRLTWYAWQAWLVLWDGCCHVGQEIDLTSRE